MPRVRGRVAAGGGECRHRDEISTVRERAARRICPPAIRSGAHSVSGWSGGRTTVSRQLHGRKDKPSGLQSSDHFPSSRKWSAKPLRKRENRATAQFSKPSAGLEPATPSLPWRIHTFELGLFTGILWATRYAKICAFCGVLARECSPDVPRLVARGDARRAG